uniref:Uncharacterized protein n=1 Tax=Knipowitschia caucasica TaxID=637954 RepID=A0AAV2JIM1_KNICA
MCVAHIGSVTRSPPAPVVYMHWLIQAQQEQKTSPKRPMPSRYGLIGSPKSKPGSPTVGQSLEDLRCMFSWSPSSPRWRLWLTLTTTANNNSDMAPP